MRCQIGKAKARKGSNTLSRRGGSGNALLSGRDGDWVYYVVNGKQFRRRFVVPKDPRTPKQLRYRAALGEASKYWSHSSELTQGQRDAYRETAVGVQSRKRLGQSGPLTGQQYVVGRRCASFHQGLVSVAVEPKVRTHGHDSVRRAGSRNLAPPANRFEQCMSARQYRSLQRLTEATWETHRVCTVNRPFSRLFWLRHGRGWPAEGPRTTTVVARGANRAIMAA